MGGCRYLMGNVFASRSMKLSRCYASDTLVHSALFTRYSVLSTSYAGSYFATDVCPVLFAVDDDGVDITIGRLDWKMSCNCSRIE